MGGCLAVHIIDFAIGGQLSVELVSVLTGQADEAPQRRWVEFRVGRCQLRGRQRMAHWVDRSTAFEARTGRPSGEQNQGYDDT